MALVKYNNNSISAVTAAASIPSGSMVLLNTNTITSGVSSSSFTTNINSTYSTYVFKFTNIHPATNDIFFEFNGSDDTSSHAYNITKTTTLFAAEHNEANSVAQLAYSTGDDLAQSTSYQRLFNGIGNGNDESLSGELLLFNPSSTTFIKHFIARIAGYRHSDAAGDSYIAGYFNTTAAITALDFKMSSGNIDSGIIKMYGLQES